MKYILTLAITLAFISCEKENRYRCECSGKRGVVLYFYDQDRKDGKDAVPYCEAAEDSLAIAAPEEQPNCYLYNMGSDF